MNPLMIAKAVDIGNQAVQSHHDQKQTQAELIAQLPPTEALQATAAVESARTHRTALRLGATLVAGGVLVATPLVLIDRIGDKAVEGIRAIGGVLAELAPKEVVQIDERYVLSSVELPDVVPLTINRGRGGIDLKTGKHVLGLGLWKHGSTTAVEVEVKQTIDLAPGSLQLGITKDMSLDSSGKPKNESHILATVALTTKLDGDIQDNIIVESTIAELVKQQTDDELFRSAGAVVRGSNADKRLQVANKAAKERWSQRCAELLPNYLDEATTNSVTNIVQSVEQLLRADKSTVNAADVLKKLLTRDIIVVFKDANGTTISPADIKLPAVELTSKKQIAVAIDVDEDEVRLSNEQSECLISPIALNDLQTIEGQK